MDSTASFNTTPLEPSKFKINTKYFTPYDLSLFVDSLETLSRLARKRAASSNMNEKMPALPSMTSLSSFDFSEGETETNTFKNKKIIQTVKDKKAEYDESYFSAPNSAHSSPRNSALCDKPLTKKNSPSTCSVLTITDSDDSGIFPLDSAQTHTNTDTLQFGSKSVTAKSLLLNLMGKKETNPKPPIKLISCRALGEYDILKIDEDQQSEQVVQLADMPKPKRLGRYLTLNMRRKSRGGFSCSNRLMDEHILNKALRYLTL